jgi:hypothetical protein
MTGHPRHRQNREGLCALSAWRSACSAGTGCAGHVDEAFSHVRAVRDRIGQGEDFTGYGSALADFARSLRALWAATLMILAFQPHPADPASSSSPACAADGQANRIRRDDRHSRAQESHGWHHSPSRSRGVAESRGLNRLASGLACRCWPSAIWLRRRWGKRPTQAHRPRQRRDRRVGTAGGIVTGRPRVSPAWLR